MVSFARMSTAGREDNNRVNAISHILNTSQGELQLKNKIDQYVSSPNFNLEETLNTLNYLNRQRPTQYNQGMIDNFAKQLLADLDLKDITHREELLAKYPDLLKFINTGFEKVLPPKVKDIYSIKDADVAQALQAARDKAAVARAQAEAKDEKKPYHPLAKPPKLFSDVSNPKKTTYDKFNETAPDITPDDSVSVTGENQNPEPEDVKSRKEAIARRLEDIRRESEAMDKLNARVKADAEDKKIKDLKKESTPSVVTGASTQNWANAAAQGNPTQTPSQRERLQEFNESRVPVIEPLNIPPDTNPLASFANWSIRQAAEASRVPYQELLTSVPESELKKLLNEKYISFLKKNENITPEEKQLLELYNETINNRDDLTPAEKISQGMNADITPEEIENYNRNLGFEDILKAESNEITERHERERQERLRAHERKMESAFNGSWNSGARRQFEREFQERENAYRRNEDKDLFHARSNLRYKNQALILGQIAAQRDRAARQAALQQGIDQSRHQNIMNAGTNSHIARQGISQRALHTFDRAFAHEANNRTLSEQELQRMNEEKLRAQNHSMNQLSKAVSLVNGTPIPNDTQMPHVAPYMQAEAPRSGYADIGGAMIGAHGAQMMHQDRQAQLAATQAQTNAANMQTNALLQNLVAPQPRK